MAKENKTVETDASVEAFLDAVPKESQREDSYRLVKMMREITGKEPKMWGPSIVGFGSMHYKYASGREGDMPLAAFSPRKASTTVYVTSGFDGYEELLGRLGKHTSSKACLYIKKLDDVDEAVLRRIIAESMEFALQIHEQ